jgi:hypothetical protein
LRGDLVMFSLGDPLSAVCVRRSVAPTGANVT